MTRSSLPFHDGLGRTHRVRFSSGGVSIPARLSHLAPQISAVLMLDEIKTQIQTYNREFDQNRTLSHAPTSGWCGDCQSYLEADEHCGCQS